MKKSPVVDIIRGITRPLIAYTLVIAVIGLAYQGDEEAAKTVATLATAASAFWFAQHVQAKDG